MRIVLPYHFGSGNRGCEGIARGIQNVFHVDKNDYLLFERGEEDYNSDKLLKIDEIGTLIRPYRYDYDLAGRIRFDFAKGLYKLGKLNFYNKVKAEHYFSYIKPEDWVFITGGDVYSYENGYLFPNLLVKLAKEKGIKTVLYCSSLEETYLNDEAFLGLRNYDCIITRETLSHSMLLSHNIDNYLIPDSAFSLRKGISGRRKISDNNNLVGINLSPYTMKAKVMQDSIENLIDFLLSEGFTPCLLPHVFWSIEDDRTVLNTVKEKYGDKVIFLETNKLGYLDIRDIISNFRFFVGSRTHSVISAYCDEVPTLALGYSIKSVGIAKDLGLPEFTVVNTKNVDNTSLITDRFKKLVSAETMIKDIYSKKMENYKAKAFEARKIISDLDMSSNS